MKHLMALFDLIRLKKRREMLRFCLADVLIIFLNSVGVDSIFHDCVNNEHDAE